MVINLCYRVTPQSAYCTLNLTRPQASSKPVCDSLPSLSKDGFAGTKQPIRYIAEWNAKRGGQAFTKYETIVFSLSLGTFLLYFMYLREPSDIDEYMSQPIWKRVPGIDPERAGQMMEVDKYLGLQVGQQNGIGFTHCPISKCLFGMICINKAREEDHV